MYRFQIILAWIDFEVNSSFIFRGFRGLVSRREPRYNIGGSLLSGFPEKVYGKNRIIRRERLIREG